MTPEQLAVIESQCKARTLEQHNAGWKEYVPALCAALRAAWAEVERLKRLHTEAAHEIEQTLGKALGYPWFKDDPKNFHDATEADGVCVGEHVAETLASEAAREIERLKGIIAQHDLCHDLHGKVGPLDFAKGCEAEQRRIYGCAPHADEVERLRAEVERLRARNAILEDRLEEWSR